MYLFEIVFSVSMERVHFWTRKICNEYFSFAICHWIFEQLNFAFLSAKSLKLFSLSKEYRTSKPNSALKTDGGFYRWRLGLIFSVLSKIISICWKPRHLSNVKIIVLYLKNFSNTLDFFIHLFVDDVGNS